MKKWTFRGARSITFYGLNDQPYRGTGVGIFIDERGVFIGGKMVNLPDEAKAHTACVGGGKTDAVMCETLKEMGVPQERREEIMSGEWDYPAGADAELKRLERDEKEREQLEEYVCSSVWIMNHFAGTDLSEDDWAKLQEEGFITDGDTARLADLAQGKGITP